MSRDEVEIYCEKRLPKRDVVIHTLIDDEDEDGQCEYPAGWTMGVKYLTKPPPDYGSMAATPNVASEHISRVIPRRSRSFWLTEMSDRKHRNEQKAVEDTLAHIHYPSPYQQAWRRFLIRLKGPHVLARKDMPSGAFNAIQVVAQRVIRHYTSVTAIVLIGSYAEGSFRKDSDIDMVLITRKKIKYSSVSRLTEDIGKRVQLIPMGTKTLNFHFRNSTTMAYSIQRGTVVFQRGNLLQKYHRWPLRFPSDTWMKDWFDHWARIYSFGVRDYRRSKRTNFDYVSDSLTRGVVNFAILFLETKGFIPTTKRELREVFDREIGSDEIKEGLDTALESHHSERDLSLKEAEKVFLTGEYLRKELTAALARKVHK